MIDDYSTGLLAFARAVEAGSFTGAARQLGATPSAVSRAVARLERRLDAVLLKRSTRSLSLTPEGRAFHEEVAPALNALREAEGAVGGSRTPEGVVRLSASIDLGRMLIATWANDIAHELPRIALELNVTDRLVDLRREAIDLAVRVGTPPPPSFGAEVIGEIGYAVVASPAYLAERGRPEAPADLAGHGCLQYLTVEGRTLPWSFAGEDVTTTGTFATDDGGALRMAALSGGGIGYLLRFAVAADLAEGSLVELLAEVPKASLPVMVFHPFGARPPSRVRAVLAFLRSRLQPTE